MEESQAMYAHLPLSGEILKLDDGFFTVTRMGMFLLVPSSVPTVTVAVPTALPVASR